MEYIIGATVLGLILYVLFNSKSRKNSEPQKPKQEFVLTEEFKDVLRILNETNESVFITGKAGTGKSSLLKYFIERSNKKIVVLAPTGLAALNVAGQTIHSFFNFGPGVLDSSKLKPDYVRAELFKNLQVVIIDEVSMARSDLMDGIDVALRINRNKVEEPFGGLQMVFIGDLFQLSPVLPSTDRSNIMTRFGGEYFFHAPVFKSFRYHFKELTQVFRQSSEQERFKMLLNNIRIDSVKFDDMVLLNSRHKSNVGEQEGAVFLTTRRSIAENINSEKLSQISGDEFEFVGALSGKYAELRDLDEEKIEDKLPAPYKLKLKLNSQIMMLKNDPGRRWVNGSIGKVSRIDQGGIYVNIDGSTHKVEKESWKEVEYVMNKESKEIEEMTKSEFCQYPVRLAYAITIHKSQGKTFDKVTIDVGAGAFAHGQVYVALSRCRTLEGIVLNNEIRNNDIIVDSRIVEYYKNRRGDLVKSN